MEMSSSVLLSLCIIWSLFAGSISYTEDVVHYRTYPYEHRNSYIPQTSGSLNPWDSRLGQNKLIYRRNTQVPSYTRLMKVEKKQKENDPLVTISETLGALNTVGNYIVNVTKGVETSNYPPKELPSALYTISKNILGVNVTDSIAPFMRGATLPLKQTSSFTRAPLVQQQQQQRKPTDESANRDKESTPTCTTAEGVPGKCQNLSNCPQLLLDLTKLKESFCFKNLFTPGVCCPVDKIDNSFIPSVSSGIGGFPTRPPIQPTKSTERPFIRPTRPATPRPIPLYPVPFSTTRPITSVVSLPSSSINNTNDFEIGTIDNNFIQDDDFTQNCGVSYSGKFRVIGGEEALPGRWPWAVAIFLTDTKRTEFWCGGTLIGQRHILTAAHCTRNAQQKSFHPRQFIIRLGDIDLERNDEPSSPVNHQVKAVYTHENFERIGYYNDIAILELIRPVRKTPYVIPICLPHEKYRNDSFVGKRPTVVGWGSTYYGGKESPIQRQAVLPVWRNEDCKRAFFQPIRDTFLCAGYIEGRKDACQGDSGGPLMLKLDGRWTQIGVVSFGNKCGEPNYPGVYTRVTKFLDWIKDRIK